MPLFPGDTGGEKCNPPHQGGLHGHVTCIVSQGPMLGLMFHGHHLEIQELVFCFFFFFLQWPQNVCSQSCPPLIKEWLATAVSLA